MEEAPKNNYLEKMEEVGKKRDANGSLSLTAEDHHGMGSTPPDKLRDNPGKAEVELMTDDEILKWLNERKKNVEELSADTSDSSFIKSYLPTAIEEIESSVRYLKEIGRLPEGFEENK